MLCIITGDVINSKNTDPRDWLDVLKNVLNQAGPSPKNWEIFRGDSFQLIVSDPAEAFMYCMKIKAAVKSVRNTDVRMAIGIGEMSYSAEKITESNGSAFVNSGGKFESLKKEKTNLAIRSAWEEFDDEMNVIFGLALIAMDNWTVNAAEIVLLSLGNQGSSQAELGSLIGIKQNAVSTRLKRAYYNELMELNRIFKLKLSALL